MEQILRVERPHPHRPYWPELDVDPGLAEMAAAYLFHLCRNHAFTDGNKRVAVLAALIFLKVNGVERLPEPDDLEAVTLEVASGERSKDDLTGWLRQEVGDFPVSSS